MRERYLEGFDAVRIDCLNGDKYKTGKVAPDGSPDPSIFSTEGDPVGIQVGTAITTLVRKADHAPGGEVGFRHLWGQAKRTELLVSSEADADALYDGIEPVLTLGLPFVRTAVSEGWFGWPSLPDLFPVWFPGVQTKRDAFLIDTDLERLRARVTDYFDASLSHDEIARRYPVALKSSSGFAIRDAHAVRDALLARGGPSQAGFVSPFLPAVRQSLALLGGGTRFARASGARLQAACVPGECMVGHAAKATSGLVASSSDFACRLSRFDGSWCDLHSGVASRRRHWRRRQQRSPS